MGDIVVIRDHLNAIPGCFRPGMSPPVKDFPGGMLLRSSSLYDPALAALAMRAAKREGFRAVEGTYLATLGPTYESRSEYRMMRRMGADVAGMSTVPEVLVAHEYGIEVLALSLVSNVANPDRPVKTTHQDVLDAGRMAAVKMETILRAVLSRLRD